MFCRSYVHDREPINEDGAWTRRWNRVNAIAAFQCTLVSKAVISTKKSAAPTHLVICALFRPQVQKLRNMFPLPQLGCDYHAKRRRQLPWSPNFNRAVHFDIKFSMFVTCDRFCVLPVPKTNRFRLHITIVTWLAQLSVFAQKILYLFPAHTICENCIVTMKSQAHVKFQGAKSYCACDTIQPCRTRIRSGFGWAW